VIKPSRERFLSTPGKIRRTYGFVNRYYRPVPKVTQEHLEARRTQILDGARRAFAEYGYDGATVARLEAATGLSRGAIFHYFGSKRELFFEVAVDVNRRYTALITTDGLGEVLRAVAGENPELIAVLIETEMRMRRDEDFLQRMEAISREQLPAFEAWFEEQRDRGVFRADIDWQHLARFATMVTNGLALRVAGGDETDVETVVRLLEDALRPQP
jgi:AcrR family transcriptional regulator